MLLAGSVGLGVHAATRNHVHALLLPALYGIQVGQNAFEVSREHIDGLETVSEKLIALAVLRLLETEKYVVEGGGATGLAAILPGGPLNTPAMKGELLLSCFDFQRRRSRSPTT